MIYIVKLTPASDIKAPVFKSATYLGRLGKVVTTVAKARPFSNPGHAKNALKQRTSYRKRTAPIGDTVEILRCELHTVGVERWIVS